MTKVKQLQQQGTYIAEIATKCKSKSGIKYSIIWMNTGLYRKIKGGLNIFHAITFPHMLKSYILYDSHNALGHNGSTRL